MTLANLGGILGDTGRPNEAEEAYRQALPLARQAATEGTGPDISAQIESTMAKLRGQDSQPDAEPANSTDR